MGKPTRDCGIDDDLGRGSDQEVRTAVERRRRLQWRRLLSYQLGGPGRVWAATPEASRVGAACFVIIAATVTLLALLGGQLGSFLAGGPLVLPELPDGWWAALLVVWAMVNPVVIRTRLIINLLMMDTGVLGFWLVTLPGHTVLMLWLAVVIVVELATRHMVAIAFVNMTIVVPPLLTATTIYLIVSTLWGGALGSAVGVALACAAYALGQPAMIDLFDRFLANAGEVRWWQHRYVWAMLGPQVLLGLIGWFVGTVLAPGPVRPLVLAAAMVAFVVSARWVNSRFERRRRAALVERADAAMASAGDIDALLHALVEHSQELLRGSHVHLRPWPPRSTSRLSGLPVVRGQDEIWLVAELGPFEGVYEPFDLVALEEMTEAAGRGIERRGAVDRAAWSRRRDPLSGLATADVIESRLRDITGGPTEPIGAPPVAVPAVVVVDVAGLPLAADEWAQTRSVAAETLVNVLGQSIGQAVPRPATVGRIGARFVVVLPVARTEEETQQVAVDLLAVVGGELKTGYPPVPLRASVGYACSATLDGPTLYALAVRAVARVQHGGGGAVVGERW